LYTPQIFEIFQKEYERSLAAYTKFSGDGRGCLVGITTLNEDCEQDKEYLVVVDDHSQGKVSCSCQQFQRVGILCSHALKILDLINIKQIPEHYALKRWTREARCGVVQDILGRHVIENPKLDVSRRYKFLSRRFNSLASQTANSEESEFLDNALHAIEKQMEEKWKGLPANTSTSQMPESLSAATRLKKKERKKGGSKRTKTWAEKLHKRNKKTSKGKSMHGEKESEAIKSHPQIEMDSGVEDYAFSGSFTQLLMVETSSLNSFMKSLPKACSLLTSLP
jgi:hypothetical protein